MWVCVEELLYSHTLYIVNHLNLQQIQEVDAVNIIILTLNMRQMRRWKISLPQVT